MDEIKAVLTEKIKRTDQVFSFRFKPPAALDFLPGQFTRVILDEDNAKNQALNKYLSYSCAPGKPYFEVTKKISNSEFSGRLMSLKEGARITFKPALGHCVFLPSMNEIGFIVGGIGITPVISILEYIYDHRLDAGVRLIYSNWTSRDIAFRAELDRIAAAYPRIKVTYVLNTCGPEDAGCFSGTITQELIAEQMPDNTARDIFIFGPPGLVNALAGACRCLGCGTEHLKIENFIGY
jgi:ferredoxin-NADP reductase